MVLVIDNYDSFTYNLVQRLGELGARVRAVRNDAIDVKGIRRLRPTHLVVSPGPCTPAEAGVSVEAIRTLAGELPILGVCLGHQSIGVAFGGRVVRAKRPVHGKPWKVRHRGGGVFRGLPDPLQAGRYHSLVVERRTLPRELEITGWTDEGEIMGLRSTRAGRFRVEGVQFHPESILTPDGQKLLKNFLEGR